MSVQEKKARPLPKKRPEPHESEEGAPAWMATFADLMSLLLTFFVLLLSFANMDIQKFQDMMGSVQDAFGVQKERGQDTYIAFSPTRYERKEIKLDKTSEAVMGLSMAVQSILTKDESLKKNVDLKPDDSGLLMRVRSGVMFAPGSASLKPGASDVLDKVITILKNYNFDLVVRGHTDDSTQTSSSYPSNWELSSARAAAAVRYILGNSSLSPFRLKAVGYADTRPLLPNINAANRAMNRRVEFYFRQPAGK